MQKKHVLRKKLYVIGMVFLLIISYSVSTFAAGVTDWTNLPGYKIGTEVIPHVLTQTSTGIQVYSAKGQFDMTANVSGIIYNTPVNPDNLSVEFTVQKIAESAGNDAWISFCLLNAKDYFHLNPAIDQGIVSLLAVDSAKLHVSPFAVTTGYNPGATVDFTGNPVGKTYKVEIKKNADGKYDYKINGTAVATLDVASVFTGKQIYLSMGLSSKNPLEMQITITKINGISLAAAASSSSSNSTSSSSSTANPTTGDQGSFIITIIMILSAIIIAITVIFIKRKICKE